MIHVVAVITAKPGRREEVLGHFRANVPAVLAEKGCIEYVPVVDVEPAFPGLARYGPDTFVVVEKWESPEALRAHGEAPHMAAYAAKTKDMVAGRSIYVLTPVLS
jgi:quinol monooxygenase YgiN